MVEHGELRDFVEWTWDEAALPVLMDYTTIPSLSPAFDAQWEDRGALAQAAALLHEWAANRPISGITTRLIEQPGRTPLLVAEAGESGPLVLLYGHLDKQPPMGTWSPGLHPFKPVRRGNRLYGRGTADDGYALFAALTAMEAAQTLASLPRCMVLIEASEESGSPDLAAHLEDLELEEPELIVCLDSGCLTYDRLWTTSSLRGNVVATVRIDVLTQGVHSGMAAGVVPDSFRILRRLLSRIEDPESGQILLASASGHRSPDALATAIPSDVDLSGPTTLPIVPGLHLAGDTPAERLALEAWSAALTVTGIDGVPSVPDGGNVLRPFTAAKISLRLPPLANAAAVAQELHQVLTQDPPEGAAVDVVLEEPAQGWLAPTLQPWVADALRAASEAAFGRPPGAYGMGGSIPFLPTLQHRFPEAQFVATGVLGPGSNAHGPDEFLHLPTAKALTACVARLLVAAGSLG